jgi:hypothetical protein
VGVRPGVIAPGRRRSTVTIWVNARGDVTTRPPGDSDAVAGVVFRSVPPLLRCSVATFVGISALTDLG